MKEFSIEEKAKAYDEALYKAKQVYKTPYTAHWDVMKELIEHLFPELAESEEEKIKEAIGYAIGQSTHSDGTLINGVSFEEALAWLEKQYETFTKKDVDDAYLKGVCDAKHELEKQDEHAKFCNSIQVGDKVTRNKDGVLVNLSQLKRVAKPAEVQGEQKPADKIEPKFHEGEWIIHHGTENIYQVVSIIDNQYQLKYGDNYTIQNCADVDRCARLWDITKDAKDGDVIYSRHNTESFEWIGIFKSLDKENKRVFFYGFWHDMAKSFSVCGNEAYVLYDDFSPATKEQRDTLKKAMADAGYSFDFEKKELKKIVVPIFKIGDTIIKKHNFDINRFDLFTITDITGGKYWYNDRIICDIIEQDDWELVEQKSSWNEKDRIHYNKCLQYLESISPRKEDIEWFKSLKERVQPQPKQECSKEDENNILFLTSIIEECFKDKEKITLYGDTVCANFTKENVIDRLKSLRPQPQWKPSFQQMKQLEWVIEQNKDNMLGKKLMTLYKDLEKLREE